VNEQTTQVNQVLQAKTLTYLPNEKSALQLQGINAALKGSLRGINCTKHGIIRVNRLVAKKRKR
jgi:hypothetical protein